MRTYIAHVVAVILMMAIFVGILFLAVTNLSNPFAFAGLSLFGLAIIFWRDTAMQFVLYSLYRPIFKLLS